MRDPARSEAFAGRMKGTATTEGTRNTACMMSTTEREARAPRSIRYKSQSCHKEQLNLDLPK